jgi:hypothetical protein
MISHKIREQGEEICCYKHLKIEPTESKKNCLNHFNDKIFFGDVFTVAAG